MGPSHVTKPASDVATKPMPSHACIIKAVTALLTHRKHAESRNRQKELLVVAEELEVLEAQVESLCQQVHIFFYVNLQKH